jgi:hypothetical protein
MPLEAAIGCVARVCITFVPDALPHAAGNLAGAPVELNFVLLYLAVAQKYLQAAPAHFAVAFAYFIVARMCLIIAPLFFDYAVVYFAFAAMYFIAAPLYLHFALPDLPAAEADVAIAPSPCFIILQFLLFFNAARALFCRLLASLPLHQFFF